MEYKFEPYPVQIALFKKNNMLKNRMEISFLAAIISYWSNCSQVFVRWIETFLLNLRHNFILQFSHVLSHAFPPFYFITV